MGDEVGGNRDMKRGEELINRQPAGVIIRAGEVASWHDGQVFRQAAESALQDANTIALEIAERSRDRGYMEGWAAGSKDVFDLLLDTKVAVDEYHLQLQTTLTQLVVDILKKVVSDLDAEQVIISAVKTALQNEDISNEFVLFASPSSLAGVRDKFVEDKVILAKYNITFREDEMLPKTGCRLVSRFGSIDLSIDRQLDLLFQSMWAALHKAKHEDF